MYSTCLFCNKELGENEALETFPVGRRLAFDAAKGRLWVVCKRCERWNLTPLEERWEAIEQAERLYRDTRKRVSTDQIGLAKLRDGTELVRIGEPLRPEFAAWRYGDQFGRRRRRQMVIAGAGLTAVGGLVIGGAVAGVTVGSFAWMFQSVGRYLVNGSPETIVARVRTEQGEMLPVRRRHLAETSVTRDDAGQIALDLRFVNSHKLFPNARQRFVGAEALRIASLIVPHVNRFGASKNTVADAVRSIEDRGGTEGYLDRLSQVAHVYTKPAAIARRRWNRQRQAGETGLFGLSAVDRIALEMSLHEDAERRALEGDLALLERAWREAEEIAEIADNLTVPEGVSRGLENIRRR